MNENDIDVDNLENTIKKVIPEFVDITKVASGRIANFAQAEMSKVLSGVVPDGQEAPMTLHFRIERKKNG